MLNAATTNQTKPGLVNDTKQSSKNIAQAVAKQIAQEPIEILKQAGSQLFGNEQTQDVRMQNGGSINNNDSFNQNQEVARQRDKIRSQRLMDALKSELDDIKKKKEQEKQIKIRQEEMAREEQQTKVAPLVEPPARKGRRLFNFGKKTQMQRQQTQTENPLPPSG